MPTKWEYQDAIRQRSGLPGPARWIATLVTNRAGVETCVVPDRFAWSLDELAEESGFSVATVKRQLTVLEDEGWLKRSRSVSGRTGYAGVIPDAGSERATSQSVVAQSELAQPEPVQSELAQSDLIDGSERAVDEVTVSQPYKEVHQVHQFIEEPTAPPAAALDGEKPTKGKRGTRLPADFHATAEMIEWARQETPLVGAKETATFIDYWRAQPGQRGLKLDWQATWRNWMRRAQADAEARVARGQPRASPPSNAPVVIPADRQCPDHRGQRRDSCRICASNRKGAPKT